MRYNSQDTILSIEQNIITYDDFMELVNKKRQEREKKFLPFRIAMSTLASATALGLIGGFVFGPVVGLVCGVGGALGGPLTLLGAQKAMAKLFMNKQLLKEVLEDIEKDIDANRCRIQLEERFVVLLKEYNLSLPFKFYTPPIVRKPSLLDREYPEVYQITETVNTANNISEKKNSLSARVYNVSSTERDSSIKSARF